MKPETTTGEGRTGAGIIDVHAHCFTSKDLAGDVARQLAGLRQRGITQVAVAGMVNDRLDAQQIWGLVPDWVENRGDGLFDEARDLLEHARLSKGAIVPLLDTRYLWGDIPGALGRYLRQGFRGIKGVYLPDPGNDLGVKGVPDTFGITVAEYRKREWEIFSFAEANDLPVLYHIDARRYGDTMAALLADFPRVRVNFPHFGIGRKAFSPFLDRYPNLYTDFSGLLSHMRENRESYRDFILQYQDRVCFGSDAILYKVEGSAHYLDALYDLGLPEEVLHKVCVENPLKLMGSALSGACV
ncbi:amidohydrolase family protein [Geomonas anaerohicana]|uniref:Amidohydrolase n=1 Tax=Geomonas anaerohicana TaxID=2798583 RepID=A0ABS0YBA3_9BACT|nr:amidohydrolase family protein [Geomonas anaerohicana]MBJ6749541.1 amidohydrolase [Geomonas anaerohicana]